MMNDETLTTKEQWYDLSKYKDEVRQYIINRRYSLDQTSKMYEMYQSLYRTVYAGTEESDIERFPHNAEVFKVYKSALIDACLPGYSALFTASGEDAYSVLKAPDVAAAMTKQAKSMTMVETLSQETVDDWLFKGEAVGILKLKDNKEEYRIKETVKDEETGQDLLKFTLIEGVNYENLEFERIDPLDFYIDAYDYDRDPLGCPKIVRSFINSKSLLTSNAYPLLSREDKMNIIEKEVSKYGSPTGGFYRHQELISSETYSRTAGRQIEVLTFRGDYVTNDGKVLSNIIAVLVGGQIADIKYNEVSTNRLIYAAYKIDRQTHRGISPLASSNPINRLLNRAVDMFLKNMEDVSNPIILYGKGTIQKQDWDKYDRERKLEYSNVGGEIPQFWAPPPAAASGLDLLNMILQQNKSMLGLNNYMSGDTTGAVRTARESAILSQRVNARMRVETDIFSYNFMLRLFQSLYSFNRELALAAKHPLEPIFADEALKISISTNASRADEEGEMNKLMNLLNLPIAQMIFSNLTPQQIIVAVRYLMAKAGLKDADNILELVDEEGNTTQLLPTDKNGNVIDAGTNNSNSSGLNNYNGPTNNNENLM